MAERPVAIMGHRVHPLSLTQAVSWIQLACAGPGSRMSIVHTINVDHFAIGQRDPVFRAFMSEADLTLADGAPVVAAARIAGAVECRRVAGQDLFTALATDSTMRIPTYLMGSAAHVNAGAFEKLMSDSYPGLVPVGRRSPRADELSDCAYNADLVDDINRSGAALLIVTLGAPRQELWLAQHRDRLKARVGIGLGSTLDVFVGNARRAPRPFRALGLEWAYRLGREPRRLARRYLIDDLPIALRLLGWGAAHRLGTSKQAKIDTTTRLPLPPVASVIADGAASSDA